MKDNTALKGIVALVVLGALVGGTIFLNQEEASAPESTSDATTAPSQSTTQQVETPTGQPAVGDGESPENDTYTDGTYTASGSYSSPGGNESIEVTLVLERDTITSVELTPGATHPTSKQFQESFIEGIAELVVGVNIDEADVDFVSGSSLTSRGFNAALDEIKGQATQT